MNCDHTNDYWPFEEEAGFCPQCRQVKGRGIETCKHCGWVKTTTLIDEAEYKYGEDR